MLFNYFQGLRIFHIYKAGLMYRLFLCIFILTCYNLNAQHQYTIKGKVTDLETNESMPYVNVYEKNGSKGTKTDFDGYYKITFNEKPDSLKASYTGYEAKLKPVKDTAVQTINFSLKSVEHELEEIKITPKENPAFPIMRNVIKNKPKNDKRALNAYQYESYNKAEVDIDNINKKLKQNKLLRKVIAKIDSIKKIKGEEGQQVIPVFISETISNIYYRENPKNMKEEILASQIKGTGVKDGSFISQFIGGSIQEYNFYENWMKIISKDFISPIADGWKDYYYYDLEDSNRVIEGDSVYKLHVQPKREQDLAFNGTIWITKKEYALKQVDLTIDKSANLNFVNKIKIQQLLTKTDAGPWMPQKTRVLFDASELTKNAAGVLVKYYSSNKDFKLNQPKKVSFFDRQVVKNPDYLNKKQDYWQEQRHDSLTKRDKDVYNYIDTLKNLPTVKTYIEVVNILVNGYKKIGPIDVGPYLYSLNYNSLEGVRIRAGFKTNEDFSERLTLNGYLAYGTRDNIFKYGGGIDYLVSKKNWTKLGANYFYDTEQVALLSDFDQNFSNLFYASSWLGNIEPMRPFYQHNGEVYLEREVYNGIMPSVSFNWWNFEPAFPFAYYPDTENLEGSPKTSFTNASVVFQARFARNERFIYKDNERLSLGTEKWPVLTLRYSLGLKDVFGSNFHYQNIGFQLNQNVTLGRFGETDYVITGGYNFNVLPYPLLKVHLGNETPFYNSQSFSMMNFFEFVSDKYASLHYQHHFNGYFFNRIPLLKKLKLRTVVSSNIAFGSVSDKNFAVIPDNYTQDGEKVKKFGSLNPEIPYAEIGYGIENIARFIRVEVYHRLTYLDKENINKAGVRLGFQFRL